MRDNSLLFSLKELGRLEEERLETERAEGERAREAARRAEAERARRETEAEARRVEEEAARRKELERQRRREQAEMEAVHQAAVERARAEVAARSAVELERVRHDHAVEVARVQALGARRRYRWLLGASVAVTATVGVFAGVLSRQIRQIEARAREQESSFAVEREGCVRAARALDSTRRDIAELEEKLRVLRSGPAAVPAVPKPPPSAVPPLHRPRPAAQPSTGFGCGYDGDPLGDCSRR